MATVPLIGTMGGTTDLFWHLLLDGPMMLAEAVAGFTLSVTSEPSGASILLDGSDTGATTPAEIGDVSLSVHNVTVALDGYLPGINETVEGTAGGTTAVHFDLLAAGGDESPLEPSFSANTTSGTVPLAVAFADESAGTPTGWLWEFGDGATSAEQNPVHTYANAGTYTVSLTVTNAEGSATAVRDACIEAIASEEPEFGIFSVSIMGGPAPAPSAAFTGTPTSGLAPLTVTFTDASTGDPTGWAWFFGDETYGGAWTEQTVAAGWTARAYHSSVALPDGSIVLMGGGDLSGALNDTWQSTDNGATWTEVNASSGWSARVYHTSVALPDGSLVLMGGAGEDGFKNDTWRSTDNGATWTEVNTSSGWPARYDHSSVVLPDGSLVLMGGVGDGGFMNDTWRSTDNGTTWTEVNASSGWSARTGHSDLTMPDGSIVLMGGNGASGRLNDVWRSTDNGTTWTLVNASSGWPARTGCSNVALPDGSIVLMGGQGDSDRLNDTWRSADGGATWTQLPSAGWPARGGHTSVAMRDRIIALMGGLDSDENFLNDVWRLQLAGSAEQNPSHTYTAVGTYSVTLQAYNNGGYDSTCEIDYITVTEPLEADFTGTPTSGLAPLIVSFTDASTGSPTAWNWSFGDGAWFNTTNVAEKNPTHTYTAVGNYQVGLTVANAVDEDTLTRDNYITVVVPPAADFTGAPTSGAAPLTVSFTDQSTGATGWAWFFGDEAYGEAWTNQTATGGEPGWSARAGHSSVALRDGSLVLMGGVGGSGSLSDTWRSADNGATWTLQTEDGGWSARAGHSSVALPGGSLVLMGGMGGSGPLNDTWRSADGGGTWTLQTEGAGWSARYGHSSVVLPDGSIVLMGGADSGFTPLNDTWRSTDNGTTWTLVNTSSGWLARYGHSSVALPDGSIVLMGGQGDSDRLNDTWRSTDNGATWALMNASAGWSGRLFPSSVALPDGSIVLAGGQDGVFNPQHDVWRSTDNGATWTQLPNAGWSARFWHSNVALPDGSLVLIGGMGEGPLNDVWRLQPAGSTEQSPSHTYTEVGTYPVTLQAYNGGGYDSTRKVDYITVMEPPGANFTGTPTSGLAPLAVSFTDASTGSPTAWNWSFGDGAWFNTTDAAERNATHTYTVAGTYTVNLTAGNAAGTDTLSRTGYITVMAPPAADFTGAPTSGPAPLNVSFTEQSTGDPTGWTWFFGDETYGQAWTEQTDNAGWSARYGHSSAALPDGSIVLMGGADSGFTPLNDTWRSTDGGATWTQLPDAGWLVRFGHSSVALPDGSIVLMGGTESPGGETRFNDTWRSVDGGATWTCVNASAGWAARFNHASVVLPDGSIVLMGGTESLGGDTCFNDTWRSVDGGATWTEVNASAGWSARSGHSNAALPDGSIVLMGGVDSDSTQLNDTWRSVDGGATWTEVNASAEWLARSSHSSVALPDGSVVLMGGVDSDSTPLNDTWRSENNGATWTEVIPDGARWSGRLWHTCVAMRDGSIVLMGGFSVSGISPIPVNDVWRLQPAGSTEQNPSHIYTEPGTYPVTLQAYNAGGYNASTAVDYITVSDTPVPPAAAFSGTPTSGLAPLTVSFTDASTGDPTGWVWFFGDETYDEAWTEQTDDAGWTARMYPASVALPDGSIVFMGGRSDTDYLNDAWQSTDNGTTWTRQTEHAGWTARFKHASVALPDGSIVLMGGSDSSRQPLNDVWRSTDNGTTWTEVNASAGWAARTLHTSTVLSDGSIVLMGGYDSLDQSLNDVWRSTDAGATWTEMNASAGWAVRYQHSSVALPDGKIVLMGGSDDTTWYNDVWRSTDSGATWTCVNASAGWTGRQAHSSVALPDGSIVLAGGLDGDIDQQNDVWRSADGGATWTCVNASAGWTARDGHTSVALPDGSIVLIGGSDASWALLNDVWRLQPAGASGQSPSHTYTEAGTYPVTLQAYNAGGYNASTMVDYITVSAPPVASFTANVTAGLVPLAVQFTDTSANSPTTWTWAFGDGATSTERNPVHTYTSAGTYTVNLTAGNAVGTDTLSQIEYVTVTVLPPAAAFSGTPTAGLGPLTVTFTDQSTGDPTGWAWFFGDETYGEAWTEQTANAGWWQRAGHTSVALPDGSIVLMGGRDFTTAKRDDVWRSTDGATWTQVNASAGWAARYNHASVALPDGSIVLMGGLDGTTLNDVWWSTDGGTTWTRVNASAGWAARYNHASVALPDGSIVLTGGYDGTDYLNDVWRSTDNGTTWAEVNASAGWAARDNHASVALPDSSIILMGGTGAPGRLNDVWRSTDNGATWTQLPDAGWSARTGHSGLTMPDGSIVLMGGNGASGRLNDVWRSTDGGTIWTQLPDAGWPEREQHTSVATRDGSILIMGGGSNSGPKSDVWRLQPAGSTEQSPSHTYTEVGTYSVTLQAYNAGGYNASTVTDYVTVSALPVADFTANVTAGIAPLTVALTDNSIGSPTEWAWAFGDGATSTEQNPVHTYTSAGNYTVSLNASNAYGFNVSTVADYIQVLQTPVANFTATPAEGNAPVTVTFTDTSSGDITAWSWDFGDGNTSTEQNPGHTYAGTGAYTVSLNTSNAYAFNVSTVTDAVRVLEPPVAVFTFAPDEGNTPLTITFTDASVGNVTACAWDFGDGNTSTDRNATHTYEIAGTYTVSLNASNAYGFNVSTVSDAVQVLPAPVAGFTFTPSEGNLPLAVQFTDASAGNVTSRAWEFGDGQTSAEQNPLHTYAAAGIYTVSLNTSNAYGFNVSTISDAVQVLPAPAANFTYAPGEGNAPLTVQFTDTSAGNVTAWLWDFGDGNTAIEVSPSHTYTDAGTYTVSLNASNAYGFSVSTVPDAIQVLPAPAAGFTYTPDEGNAPLAVQFTDISSGNVTAWVWDFGDGNTSSDRNVTHIYEIAGTYTVSLNASNTYGWNISTVMDAVSVLPAPVANFTSTPEEGNAPLAVTFTDTSSGNVTAWNWDFGDGNTSAEQSPVHIYAIPGTYTVSFNASNVYGFNVSTVTGAVSVLPAPVANFTSTPDEGNAPLAVTFTDTSSGNVTAWLWDFGDGNTSTEQNPEHLYASAGTYTATLNTSNAYGFNISTASDAVLVLSPPAANFTYTPGEGNAPLLVQFTDSSTGNVTTWSWDFGDGQTSTEQNPEHTYAAAGIYTVTLNASNAYGFNVSVLADAISVLPAPAANFTYTPDEGNAPLTVQFTDASAGNVTARVWDFGDGNISTDANPTHTYANAGAYTISLNASNAYGFNVSTVANAVSVLPAPAANFTFTPGEGNAPLAVAFTDASVGNITAWVWDFGDGNISNEQNPSHIYVTAGTYTVSLNVSSTYGFNVSTVTEGVVVLPAPVAGFTHSPDAGNAPLTVQFDDISSGSITGWAWDFGDGQTSTEQNPEHLYASAGTYTVSLNTSNAYGYNVSIVASAVQVLPAPAADFTFAPDEGNAPLTVQFNNTSSGNVTAWRWDFGDGNESTDRNPSHTYVTEGTYAVSLNASNAYGFNVSSVSDAVLVLSPPAASFTYTPDEGNAPLTVTFTDASTGNVTAWHWDFGDGTTSAERSPVHTYATEGTYTISLNASNTYGFNVSTAADGVLVLSAPVAGFTFTPDEGNAPLNVTFTDASVGNITAWAWDFGDGNTSTEANPSHTYADAGIYSVTLNVSNIYGFNISTASDTVLVLSPPAANFIYTPDEGNAPLTVTFTDSSTGNVTAWTWDFGDGNTSTDRNTTHTYASAGTYTVSLSASNAYGFDVSVITDAINVLPTPVAGFTFVPGEGNAPLAVTFTDVSTGNVTAWHWNFGDGNESSEQNPSHTYVNAGTYAIVLNVSNAYGFNVSATADAVSVFPAPAAGFIYTPDEGNAPLTVQFNDASSGNVTLWAWDFGDGNTSTDPNPTHTYTTAGIYSVSLNASNAYGFDVSSVSDAVLVRSSPAANFTYTPDEGNAPLTVTFTDASAGNVTVWNWDFGDGNTSTEASPSHIYAGAGTYTVSLNASNPYGFNVSTVADAVHVLPAPVAEFACIPGEGNAPLAVQFTDASTGDVTAWFWDFGDGNTSAEQNPLHTYAITGIYAVSLNTSNAYGYNVSAVANAVQVLEAPNAGFTHTPGEGNVPLTVAFTDASTGNITAWLWDFGDGNVSTEQNPTHTYATAGTYTVLLNASNAYGFNVSTVANAVLALPAPIARFTHSPDEGNAPLTVTFTDASTGNVTARVWDFGDGNTSTEASPSHTYANAGVYTASLNASNTYGFDVFTVTDAVQVLPAPMASFTYTPDEGNAPLTVMFTDTSSGNVTAWAWDFGDGNVSSEQNPVHTYMNQGTYTVTLNTSNVHGSNISTVYDAILAFPAPVAGFTYAPGEGNAPLTVQFIDTSSGNITARVWNFGDGNISAEASPLYTYANAGTYTVSLNASNAYGFNVSTAIDAVCVLPVPVAGFTFAPDEGNAPLTVTFTDTSAGNVTAWTWDFGDGNVSSERSPAHTYVSAGTYAVTLNASNAYGFNVSTVADAISALPAPTAGFTFTPDEGNAPLTVRFMDASSGNVTAWAWDFGDGDTSTDMNPVHTYTSAGTYTVTLNTSNVYGFNTSTVPDAVSVLPAPVANFTHTPGSGSVPLTVAFTSTSTGNIMATAWNFGDGATSTEANPVHTYTSVGTYTVTLNVSNAYGWNSVVKQDAVIVTSHSHGKGGGGSVTPTGVPTSIPTPVPTSTSTPTPTPTSTPTSTSTSTSTPTPFPTSTTVSTPTPVPVPVVAELPMDTDGRVMETIEIVASDTVGTLTIPGGVQAWDAAGGNLQEIIIVPIDTVNLTETHNITDDTTSAFLFGQYAYRVEPDGATFSSPLTLTFNIPRDVWATLDTANMSVLWQDTESGAWETIPIASIDGNETHVWVSAAITHFSIYELFMPRIDQATPAVMPIEPTTPWFLLVVILIAIGTILYLWRKKNQNQDQDQ